jgi:hypothetical protein
MLRAEVLRRSLCVIARAQRDAVYVMLEVIAELILVNEPLMFEANVFSEATIENASKPTTIAYSTMS